MNNCHHCGKETDNKTYCSRKCRDAKKIYEKAKAKTSVCVRCEVEKPRAEFPKYSSTCTECAKTTHRTCPVCKKEKEVRYFIGPSKVCRHCVRKKNEHQRDHPMVCDRCDYFMCCSWLALAKITLICQIEPCASDDYHLAQLDPVELKLAEALLEERT